MSEITTVGLDLAKSVFQLVRRQIIWDTGCHDGEEGLALVG
jgi:hypothetical protein